MIPNKTDEKAMKLINSMKRADLEQDQIAKLVEESEGSLVIAVMKGYNAGFLRGYNKGRKGK